jgi:type II secretory pathway component GspD/PulD (secretin)
MRVKRLTPTLIVMLISLYTTSCSSTSAKESKIFNQINSTEQYYASFKKKITPPLVDVTSVANAKLAKRISILAKNINLIQAIKLTMPDLSIIADKGVDLTTNIDMISFDNSFGRYLEYLAALSDLSFELKNNVIYIKSIQTKTWNIATLAQGSYSLERSSVSAITSDGNAPEQTQIEDNSVWDNIVADVESIVKNNNDDNVKSLVLVNKKLGQITATAYPTQIKQVDAYLDNLNTESKKQIHLQAQVIDVVVDSADGRGINWNIISDQSSKFQIGNDSSVSIDGSGIFSIGSVGGATIDFGKKITLDLMLNLLKQQGKVKINNQPNITLTNGSSAHITTGDEFSYVASVNAQTDASGNVVVTSEIDRMTVGVDMKVTTNILDDNESIAVSVVPIISSLKSFSTLKSGTQEFQTPNIALQQLATQVIVKSGETIHLGGLIADKVAKASKGLGANNILNWLFEGVQESIERREIILLITPTIVN